MENSNIKAGVIGAGGWGTALAKLLCENGNDVILWSHETNVIKEINTNHTNLIYLPDIELPGRLTASARPEEISDCDVIVLAVPTQFIRQVLSDNDFGISEKFIVNVAKGIENDTLMRISEILTDIFGLKLENYILITGPSHAEEVARQMPTTVVAASDEHDSAKYIQDIFANPFFRVYTTNDVVGCEIGGALKNVIALAAGIIDGLGLGDNTKAAVITRGLAEISRLGIALGANPVTFSGLSGLGDLVVTCNSHYSRNRYVGEQIGLGKTAEQIRHEMQTVAEGIFTTKSAHFLAKKHNVELPIVEQMYKIIFENLEPVIALKELMTRQSKREWWW